MGIKLKQQDMLSQIIVDGTDEAIFCLLIGAGSSLSSGIPTAGRLVSQWKEKLLEMESKNEPMLRTLSSINDEKFLEFYKKWKNQRTKELINPSDYSVLIEYFWPTAALRQEFIEEAVDNKYPSFGYLYLSMLIDAGYFNVIFTTNFDNLINDALYRFVDSRPLVCSFDSSISSIRIKSKRPKIIKLHGDYLFHNIKNTSNEVRSLTKNMEDKFKQFCQEYGLIVIGYSGGDDSIMDIIKTMLKDDEYLKMGLHWCIKKGDKIPQALESSAGFSDRLHFYEIESFDILMSDICKQANIALPIEVTDPTKSKTITELTDSVKSQTNTNLSIKILDDAGQIVHALQNRTVDNDILIKEFHLLGKKIQKLRDCGLPAEKTVKKVNECVNKCKNLLDGKANPSIERTIASRNLTIAQKIDIHLIMGTAKISHVKVSSNMEEKIKILQEIIKSLTDISLEAQEFETSRITSHRAIFCRLNFNLACVFGLLAEQDRQNLDKYCGKAIENLNKLCKINEGLSYLEKITTSCEQDLLAFNKCEEYRSFIKMSNK